ncbi:hypothetical protein HYV49_00255 [Candidatus Pacearchaeota archaeon]|nr:hypothetical protein [Candidatus Pacearchaeota archaeon]
MKTRYKYIIGGAIYAAVTLAIINFVKCDKIEIRHYTKQSNVKREKLYNYINEEINRKTSDLDKKIRIHTDKILEEVEN